MSDTTIIYYTSNQISEFFANNVRKNIKEVAGDMPIISVSQKPLDFGHNICIGDIGCSIYNVYKQILIGAKEAKTKYVACCEDDSLYTKEHLSLIPEEDAFYYNYNRWFIEAYGMFRYRNRSGMLTCIVKTDLMIKSLEIRFAKYPTPLTRAQSKGWGEPGRYEGNLKLEQIPMVKMRTVQPIITFNHRPCLGGIRRKNETDILQENLEPWGNAKELWAKIHG